MHVVRNVRSWLAAAAVIGLAVPAMPAGADGCGQPADRAPTAELDDCCAADQCPAPDGGDRHGDEDDCCPPGCSCICCGCATLPAIQPPSPAQAWRTQPIASLADLGEAMTPQHAVGQLLPPPKP